MDVGLWTADAGDRFAWFRDEEFSRQTVAGINPLTIELIKEWPMKSNLDPKIYGPAESAITKEVVEKEIRGFTTVEEVVNELIKFRVTNLLLNFECSIYRR